jgi:hypothetical protein
VPQHADGEAPFLVAADPASAIRARTRVEVTVLFRYDVVVSLLARTISCSARGKDSRSLGQVRLQLRATDGTERDVLTEHVIAATGYKVDLVRLPFLSPEIRSKIKVVKSSPVLSSTFESSVPDIYFAGLAAANSFGPVMRFAFGAGFAARRLTETIAKARAKGPASVPVRSVATTAE